MNAQRGSGVRNLAEVRRVLIVDDNHDSAELLAVVLGRQGHETRVAYDAVEAISVAARFCPDVALLDIGLPGMDGFELLRVLRATPELACCKFVAVTGYEELREEQGFDAHLIKPVDLDSVLSLVRKLGHSTLGSIKPISA